MLSSQWNFISQTKRPTQDGTNLVALMKSIGHGKKFIKAVDVGCGDGIIAYEMLKNKRASHVTAIDIVMAAVKTAQDNLKSFIASNEAVVCRISAGKFFSEKKNHNQFDLFVINPPFFAQGSGTSNQSVRDQKARHESSLSLKVWAKGAGKLLKTGGQLYCVFPSERITEVLSLLSKNGVEPKEIWWLKDDLKKRRFFLRAVRGGKAGVKIYFDFNLKRI